jgi:hypothetical protein
MTVQEIAALVRRHLLAISMVIVVAAGVAYYFKHTPLTYVESGTVVFAAPKTVAYPNPYTTLSGGLTGTAGIMAIIVMSPQGQQQIRSAGGTASYDAELVNLYNLEYPNYSDPFVTVTATSTNPAEVHQTFDIAAQLLERTLQEKQARAGVPEVDRITTHIVGDTGLVPERGSSKRTLAGLLVLAIVAAFSVASFFDRHPIRLSERTWFPKASVGSTQGGRAPSTGQRRRA